MKWCLAACCLYEAASIIGGKTPTFTQLSADHPWLAPAILVVLAVHLRPAPKPCIHGLS